MTALFWAVFLASLLGSMHCAGMCGAFAAFAVGMPLTVDGTPVERRRVESTFIRRFGAAVRSRGTLVGAYNVGRLATYLSLGAAAGAIGSAVDLGGSMLGVQRAATVFAGLFMIGFGVVMALRLLGVKVPSIPLPARLKTLAARGHAAAAGKPPIVRAALVGLLTTLLPCGWLWAFVVTAAGTGDALRGVLVMAAFWLGTLPVMATLGAGVATLTGPMRRHMPLVTCVLLVAVGLYTVGGRMMLPMRDLLPHASAASSVPDAGELPPCCRGGE